MDRTTARAAAMKLVYEWEMGGDGGDDTRLGLLDIKPAEKEIDYMETIVAGVRDTCAELDALIGKNARGWAVERISRVDLSIMRVAVWEMRFGGIPSGVAISEALELARTYSTPESVSFINGVLGGIGRSL